MSYFSFKSSAVSKSKLTIYSIYKPRNEKSVVRFWELIKMDAKFEVMKNTNEIFEFQTVTSIDDFYRMCDIHLSPALSMIIKDLVKMGKRKPNDRRYPKELKHLAFIVYFYGPHEYSYIEKLLQLPNPKTLRTFLHKIEINPGLNKVIFEAIKCKTANLKDDAKDCVLCIKKMPIKSHLFHNLSKDNIIGFNNSYNINCTNFEPAKYVICFMLRSLNYEWIQYIAYFFINNSYTKSHLKENIFEILHNFNSYESLNIRVVTSNLGSNFTSFLKFVRVSYDCPYFYYEGKKIFCIFDVPNLLMSTRNNFFKYSFTFLKSTVHKIYLDEFYKLDQGSNKFAPELTDAHLSPGAFQKTKIKYASQVFSNSVAIGMEHYVNNGMLPLEAESTMEFIYCVDKLFDILNTNNRVGNKYFNQPFQNTEFQRNHLLHMLEIFTNMRVLNIKNIDGKMKTIDVTDQVKFVNGWIITIRSFLWLWDSMFTKSNYVLYTYRLNLDCFESIFGEFRNNNENYVNPTPIKFLRKIKKNFFLNLLKYLDGYKSIYDLGNILTSINKFSPSLSSCILFSEESPLSFRHLKVNIIDYRELKFPENNSLYYICSYLLEKCIENHSCTICLIYACNQNKIDQSFLFNSPEVWYNGSDSNNENLNISPDQFFNYINLLDYIFIKNFSKLSVDNNISQKLKKLIDCISFTHPCLNFDIEYLKTIYIRLRIFHAIKNKNMLLKSRNTKK